MRTMPGFTARDALCPSRGRYLNHSTQSHRSQAVQPSGFFLGDRFESDVCECNGGDKCCCPSGYKCCNTAGRCCCESS